MQFHIQKKTVTRRTGSRKSAVWRGRKTPKAIRTEQIRFGSLFDRAALPKGRAHTWRAFWLRLRTAMAGLWQSLSERRRAARHKRAERPRLPSLLPALAGSLCAAICVLLLCGFCALYTLILSDYFVSGITVTVPALVGQSYDGQDASLSPFEVSVTYQYHETAPPDTVLSQSPADGVERHLRKGDARCPLSLVVSLGRRSVTLPSLVGQSQRDATLTLKNQGLRVSITHAHSDTVPPGQVLSTEPVAGSRLDVSQSVTLCISLGAERHTVTVPSLVGLSESRATAQLRGVGLQAGQITYVRSDYPVGTVLSQDVQAGSQAERGTAVSLTVSAGQNYQTLTVPDLFGLTLTQAKQRLEEVGLVCGRVYAVDSGSNRGCVVAQSVLPNTPITSALTAIDLYISS